MTANVINDKIIKDPRFAELPVWAQYYTLNYVFVKTMFFVCVPIAFAIGGVQPQLALLLGLGVLALGYKSIPSDDHPFVGVSQVLDVRLPIRHLAGFTFVIPFLEKILLIDASDIDSDWTFDNIPTRLQSQLATGKELTTTQAMAEVLRNSSILIKPEFGGLVQIKVQYSVTPDTSNAWSLIDILDKKGPEGAIGFLQGIVWEDVRQTGRALTTAEYMFASDLVSIKLIGSVTGTRELSNGTDVLQNPTPENIRKFHEKVLRNGISGIYGSGFRINTLNIKEVKPLGKLGEEFDRVAIEVIKSAQLARNVEALRTNIDKLMENSDGSINHEAALAALQAEDGTVIQKRTVFKVTDSDKIAGAISNALLAFLKGKS